jgi:leucyl aminopeptidase
MKLSALSFLYVLPVVIGARIPVPAQTLLKGFVEEQQYLLQFSGGETQWVTEDEKWELKRDGRFFMDITQFRDLGSLHAEPTSKNKFPTTVAQKHKLLPLLEDLDASNIKSNLEHFTSFHNRYYMSEYGAQSSKWLLDLINSTIKQAGADKYGVTVKPFAHQWPQHSIILSIPGKHNSTIVVGAHQDSANYMDRMNGRAPGADDDGSGTVTILEVLRVLLTSKDILEGKAENTIEFHWYAAEESGLLGSQAIFREYERTSRDVKAMLEQDMTGFTNLTVEAGRKPEFGLLMDMGASIRCSLRNDREVLYLSYANRTTVEEEDLVEYMKLIIAEVGMILPFCREILLTSIVY